jgi:hypothetical protein
VSGSLGLCFCGFMAEAALAAAAAETCVWWPGLVFLRLSGCVCGGSAGFMAEAALAAAAAETCVRPRLVFLAALVLFA